MMINMLFFTITFEAKKMTEEEAMHQQYIDKVIEENRNKQMSITRFL
ncbi:YrzI family small protein [Niallia sp. FSL W8-0635]|nr:Probable sporulation protein (Bac_small_yrzI) [Mycobacteroides abscessus subsp. abscessus]HEO8419807.1 YrzI family small protein [Yersinia enterocolitica]